jgi:hypothetical protein
MACGHYTARFIFSAKIPMSFAKCFDEVKSASGKKRFKDEEEARAYTKTLFKCVDRRNAFLAKIFFDEKQAGRELTYSE